MFKFYLSSVLVLLLTGVSFGATWTGWSLDDSLWSTAANWDSGVPGSGDGVYIGATLAPEPTIDSTVAAVGGWTAIGMGYSTTLTMTGGSLTLSGLTIGERGYCTGTLDISGGTATVSGWAVLGGDTSGSTNTGIITMSGNSSLTVGSLMVGNEITGSIGTVNLNDSSVLTITALNGLYLRDTYPVRSGLPKINLAGGKLVLPSSEKAKVETGITEKWIVAYNDPNQVVAIAIVNDTTIQVVGYPKSCADAWTLGLGLDSDLNKDCVVDFKDLGEFVLDWLKCNDPAISGCESY